MQKIKKLSPLEIKTNDWFKRYFSHITFAEKIFFVDHLKTMAKAGLSLVDSLDILSKETENKKFRDIITKIKEGVEKGRQLSEVLDEYPKIFPSMYVKMIASGEMSGKLEETLEQIVIQMKKTQELLSSIRGAMVYPAVIVFAMGGIGIMMTTVVLPKLLELFSEFDAELPLPTKILMAVVGVMSNPIYLSLIILSTIGLIFLFIYLLKNVLSFKRFIHTVNLNLPIIGKVIKKVNLAKFSLTLSSLLKSTIPIVEAVEITADTCTNLIYREALHDVAKQIKNGEPLSKILGEYNILFPPMVTEMIMVGERTGEVDHLLNELSEFYSQEVDKTMKNFSTIIEPIIILILGVAVAGIAVAVIMPMYSLVQDF